MKDKMWAVLLHLATNMWEDYERADGIGYSDTIKFDKTVWDESLKLMQKSGYNTLVIDLGDAVKYKSHPEIAVKGAYEPEELKEELKRIREMGITPIPKLNFSTCHDTWLKEYSRMVSTDTYYKVCKDLIHEVIEIFEKPAYFHLGMDEEDHTVQNLRQFEFVCYRTGKLFWNDLKFLLNCVFEKDVTPWIWADHFWSKKDEFIKNVPKEVLVSAWYYEYFYIPFYASQTEKGKIIRASFTELAKYGYKQVPTGSNYSFSHNADEVIHYSKENIPDDKLTGFMMASWKNTIDTHKYYIYDGIHLASLAKDKYY